MRAVEGEGDVERLDAGDEISSVLLLLLLVWVLIGGMASEALNDGLLLLLLLDVMTGEIFADDKDDTDVCLCCGDDGCVLNCDCGAVVAVLSVALLLLSFAVPLGEERDDADVGDDRGGEFQKIGEKNTTVSDSLG